MKQFELLLTCNNFLYFFLGNLCGQETKAPAVRGELYRNRGLVRIFYIFINHVHMPALVKCKKGDLIK